MVYTIVRTTQQNYVGMKTRQSFFASWCAFVVYALLTITLSGHGASPILRRDDSNVEMEGKIEEVGGGGG